MMNLELPLYVGKIEGDTTLTNHAIAHADRTWTENIRANERLELSVPAEIRTTRGNTIAAMTREISRTGIGLLHRGAVSPGEVIVRMASETREFQYNVRIEWCTPCDNGMFMSGGCFLNGADN